MQHRLRLPHSSKRSNQKHFAQECTGGKNLTMGCRCSCKQGCARHLREGSIDAFVLHERREGFIHCTHRQACHYAGHDIICICSYASSEAADVCFHVSIRSRTNNTLQSCTICYNTLFCQRYLQPKISQPLTDKSPMKQLTAHQQV